MPELNDVVRPIGEHLKHPGRAKSKPGGTADWHVPQQSVDLGIRGVHLR